MNHHLVNYSLLESLQAQNKGDVFDHCGIFLVDVLYRNSLIKDFSIEEVQEIFKKYLNFDLPISVVKIVLDRGKKKFKFFTQKDSRYYPDKEKIEEEAQKFSEFKENAQRQSKKLLESFVNYTRDVFKVELPIENAEEIVSAYLSKYQVEIIDFFTSVTTAPEVKGKSIQNQDYLLSCFIKNIHEKEPELFKYFIAHVKGVIAKNYLISNPIRDNQESLNNVTIYLDTPVIMALLGFNGQSKQNAIEEMVGLCNKLKAKLKFFECTRIEFENILKAWANDLENNHTRNFRDSTLQLLKQNNWDHVYLRNYLSRYQSILSGLSVALINNPQLKEQHQIDSEGLKKHLQAEALSEYSAVDHDVKCIEQIVQLREYRRTVTLKDSPHIFVTTNYFLVRGVSSFFKDDFDKDSSPVISNDIWITSICWMLKPNLFPNWPEHLVVSNYQAIIFDDDKFWRDFVKRFRSLRDEKKITKEDYNIVRREYNLKRSLKMLTVTEGMSYNNEHIFDLVEKTKVRVLRDRDEKIRNQKVIIQGYRGKLKFYCDKVGIVFRYSVQVFIVLALFTISVMASKGTGYERWNYAAIAIGILLSYIGFSIKDFGSRIQDEVSHFLYQKIISLFERKNR